VTRAPSDRSHLSIGEVLSLLQEEFPDVTISKIRFLESQGLLDPERTPSGYRKFYEADIDRLRWILRQQREHYLPLKVIKDRLEDAVPPPGAVGSRPRRVRPGRGPIGPGPPRSPWMSGPTQPRVPTIPYRRRRLWRPPSPPRALPGPNPRRRVQPNDRWARPRRTARPHQPPRPNPRRPPTAAPVWPGRHRPRPAP
jgi:DNA-binding transcriptional MerR regulator